VLGAELSQRIAVRVFDLDHLGAVVAEQSGHERSIDDPDSISYAMLMTVAASAASQQTIAPVIR
jgi:hypothetical protein